MSKPKNKTNRKNKNTAPKADAKPKKEKKAPTIEQVEREVQVPGINGGPAIKMPVTLYCVAEAVLAGLEEKGAELTDEEKAALYSTRKEASTWLKAKRAELRGTPSLSKQAKQGRTLYRAAKLVSKVIEAEKVEFEAGALNKLNAAIKNLEDIAADVGFDAAAYETEQAQKKMARDAAKKKAANS